MEKAKTVGIWIRVSIEDQVKGESPEHHERHKPELRRIQRLTGQKALPFLHHKRRLYYKFLALSSINRSSLQKSGVHIVSITRLNWHK